MVVGWWFLHVVKFLLPINLIATAVLLNVLLNIYKPNIPVDYNIFSSAKF